MDTKTDIVFLKLEPEDAIRRWKYIGFYIMQALTPIAAETEFLRGNVMAAIEKRQLDVWMAMRGGEIAAIYTLTQSMDVISGTKQLIIYSLTSVRQIDRELLLQGLDNIKRQALSLGCQKVVSYTGINSLKRLGKELGANDFTTLVWSVG